MPKMSSTSHQFSTLVTFEISHNSEFDEKQQLQLKINQTRQELEKKMQFTALTAQQNLPNNSNLTISYAGNFFTNLAPDRLIAVIIGGLLLLAASRLLYEK